MAAEENSKTGVLMATYTIACSLPMQIFHLHDVLEVLIGAIHQHDNAVLKSIEVIMPPENTADYAKACVSYTLAFYAASAVIACAINEVAAAALREIEARRARAALKEMAAAVKH